MAGIVVMENLLTTKFFKISLLLLLSGIVFLCLEHAFYQYIDKNGFLHENFIMPLGIFSLFSGAVGLLIVVIKMLGTLHKQA